MHQLTLEDHRIAPARSWVIVVALGFLCLRLGASALGLVFTSAGLALLVDFLAVLWRSRGLTTTLLVPESGHVGTEALFTVRADAPRPNLRCRVGIGPAGVGAPPPAGWVQLTGEDVRTAVVPSHRGRFDAWTLSVTNRGLFGLDVIRRDFDFVGPPAFAVGPRQHSHAGLRPPQISKPIEGDFNISPVSGAEPVLREWQVGDRTSSIDWRRFERLDELVVRSSPQSQHAVIVVCDLGGPDTSLDQADVEAGRWSSYLAELLGSGPAMVVWREQDTTHVMGVRDMAEVDWILAGAEHGDFDRSVLAELGIDEQDAG